ncbi:hypothetical protein RF55_15252 [Lasius niger]|uniref:RNA-directed DNA polymerase n=1 Tax=Lasius niger TaxID=67767 RepID=A0A0J7K6D6_LASNI|nr:hypothetical protein RF55_15252 [Lasius niger]
MVRTRAQLLMDRAQLEKLTLEQLQEEAKKYGLRTTGDWSTLLGSIMSHLKQHGPIEEMRQLTTQPQKTTAPTLKVTSKRPGLTPSTSMTTLVAPAPVQNLETSNVLQQMLEAMQQQHQQLDRLYQLLADQRSETSRSLAGMEPGGINPSSARSTPSEETSRRTAESWSSGSAVQALAHQIPEFSGGEEDNIQAWVRRIDKVAQVHDKLAMMHRLDLLERDRIQLLISGIQQTPLRATALSLSEDSLNPFLDKMRIIAQGTTETERKSTQEHQQAKDKPTKDGTCKNCGKKGHSHKDCRGEPSCFYCKEKGHRRFDCPVLKKKETKATPKLTGSTTVAATSETAEHQESSTVAAVQEGSMQLVVDSPMVQGKEFPVELHILKNDTFQGDIILGRKFFKENNLTLVYSPAKENADEKVNLFTVLPLCVDEEQTNDLEQICKNNKIDFDTETKLKLEKLILKVNSQKVLQVDDDYKVEVNIKDPSVFAYAPRRFAMEERKQIRAITDDLLRRGIIKVSVSPYCARVVSVRKKDGRLRLCVDLRPLNSRVVKQKYPFPIVEECLSKLSNKKIFSLLDLRDGFHQIKIHENSTKYFSFATPDGQFEFTRLPFGYCEAPAEFQKRLIQILNPLIRQDKVIVYIDDVLIASETVEENIGILKEVLQILKKYNFELNYQKCKFLRKKIQFLGYVITAEGITLSPRHTEAVQNYKFPKDKLQLQRFLGLANYFRKFIKNFALKVKVLQNLIKKGVEFKFDETCINAFNNIKSELTSYPVLRLFNPTAETQLHTDACSAGIGAVLLQRQHDGSWAPVAYFSQATNAAESRYHSFELEMLAIVRATERFHLYLYGTKFTIITDCNALVHAVKKANLNPRIARWTLALQNYSFEITHRPGNRMVHADALSRSVALVDELPLERRLEFLQLTDPEIQKISNELELEDSDRFALIDGLVYRKMDSELKFVVPDSMISNILRAHHDDMAHNGYEKTIQGIKQSYWFPRMRKRVLNYIENCLVCLTANSAANRLESETRFYRCIYQIYLAVSD